MSQEPYSQTSIIYVHVPCCCRDTICGALQDIIVTHFLFLFDDVIFSYNLPCGAGDAVGANPPRCKLKVTHRGHGTFSVTFLNVFYFVHVSNVFNFFKNLLSNVFSRFAV